MGRDLRKLFEEERETKKFRMKQGHEKRFFDRLEKAMPKKRKSSVHFLKIAASILVLVSAGYFAYVQLSPKDDVIKETVVSKDQDNNTNQAISLGDLSPDLKKVENYYVANINLQLSQLEVSEDNKAMVDGFMDRLSELNVEYKHLNIELNNIGPNDQTITALIKNLQLRLQLLQKLKTKLNELKSSKNEHDTNII